MEKINRPTKRIVYYQKQVVVFQTENKKIVSGGNAELSWLLYFTILELKLSTVLYVLLRNCGPPFRGGKSFAVPWPILKEADISVLKARISSFLFFSLAAGLLSGFFLFLCIITTSCLRLGSRKNALLLNNRRYLFSLRRLSFGLPIWSLFGT